MPMKLRLGLRGQLLFVLAILSLLVLAMAFGLWRGEEASRREVLAHSNAAMQELARENLTRRGEQLAGQFAKAEAVPMLSGDSPRIAVVARATLNQPDVQYVIVYDQRGHIVDDGGDGSHVGQPMVDPLADAALSASAITKQWADNLLDVSAPVLNDGRRIGGVRVGLVGSPPSEAQDRILGPLNQHLHEASRNHRRWLVIALLALLSISVLSVYLLEWRVLAPIRALAKTMAASAADPERVAPVDSEREDEIGDLFRAFSRMSAGVARHDREIRRMAYTDPLTGMSNRLAFREALDDRLLTLNANSGELALLFIDLDDFKRVNDTLGHEAGDDVLSQLAVRVRMTLENHGGKGAEIARFGGDEFIVLFLADDIRASSARLAESLIEEIERPLLLAGKQVFLGASVGITLFPFDASNAGQLLKNADIAMYQAKVAGKNCYRFYSRAMDQAVERRVQLEQELRGAWERGEMSVVYQPLFHLADGRITGAEALLRWQHPRLGMVPPSVFIEVAEQSGLIESLGRHVLEAACRDAAVWPSVGNAKPFVSVNISPRQLRSGELPDVVGHSLKTSGLLPQQLHLELTETAVLSDEAQASALLSRVRATGVKVWLDDFGTGFSGLSHLRRVPVDGVKIDRSFVADVLRDPDDLALTTAIIAMAHSLGITVVAEGIETEGQYAILRERGCDQGQGFWLGRPMPAEDFLKLFVQE
ncbi:MAG TPA: EAL domain-containing protein [Arenimonas sp.]|uniref:putative bifunctional diguanylate cyclase/phosphodiesterase n=1 Tax=Arenimonas sp. TaxID=1872635 RepID=UPI002CEEF439|nr:EAL domain-containing protein [Arenimonas sp.]HMB55578.1 EAL domain-containing protein [Arenimonas sp.]